MGFEAEVHIFRSAHPAAVYTWELLVPGERSDKVAAMGHAGSLWEARQASRAKAAQLGLEVRNG